jgi:hypothetical protein
LQCRARLDRLGYRPLLQLVDSGLVVLQPDEGDPHVCPAEVDGEVLSPFASRGQGGDVRGEHCCGGRFGGFDVGFVERGGEGEETRGRERDEELVIDLLEEGRGGRGEGGQRFKIIPHCLKIGVRRYRSKVACGACVVVVCGLTSVWGWIYAYSWPDRVVTATMPRYGDCGR